ncbi:cytochrome P450 71A26-like, partial [Trifolium medium]|nr:cytochrome P450 71A26-like [Trifolium medium]
HNVKSSISFYMVPKMWQVVYTVSIGDKVAFGKRYREGIRGMKFQKVLEFGELLGTVCIGDYIPWLDWFGKVNGLYSRAEKCAKYLDEFIEQVIEEHISHRLRNGNVDNEEQSDFVDVLLSVQKNNAIGFPIDRTAIKALILVCHGVRHVSVSNTRMTLDMFAGGTDTTYTVLEWAMAELFRHETVMRKLQDEVRTVVGNRTHVTEEDLVHTSYLKAVIKETLRLHVPITLLVPRKSMEDVKLNGYDIPAGTQ